MEKTIWGDKSGLHITPKLLIDKNNTLNASANYNVPIVHLTTYDLAHLSRDDNYALLAHEVGHLKIQNSPHYSWHYIISLIYPLIIVLWSLPIIIIKLHHYNSFLIIAEITILLFLILLRYERHDEYHADRIGVYLIGNSKMIHLLRQCEKYENKQHKILIQCVKDLWICPKAELKCIGLLIIWKTKIIFNNFRLSSHPTYMQRIKYLKKQIK